MPVYLFQTRVHVTFEHLMKFFVIYRFISNTSLSCFLALIVKSESDRIAWKNRTTETPLDCFFAMNHHWSLIFVLILTCVHLIKDSSYYACFATINSSLIMSNKWVNHESVMSRYRSDFFPVRHLMPIGALVWDNRREEDEGNSYSMYGSSYSLGLSDKNIKTIEKSVLYG